MKYRIKYPLWVVESDSAEEARKKVMDFYQSGGGMRFMTLEPYQKPLWKLFLLGR